MCPFFWGSGLLAILAVVLFWVLLFAGLFLFFRALAHRNMSPAPVTPETTRAILDRRLAVGEITPEQYDDLLRKLGG